MRVGLVNPPSPFLTNERVFPNIGLVRVATKLKQEGHEVTLFDFSGVSNQESLMRIVAGTGRDHYGFSSTSAQMPSTMNLLRLLKSENPEASTTLGGAHASAMYSLRQKGIKDSNIKDLEAFDTIFAGEGEETSNMFKPGWQKGKLITDIDSVPIPDRDFINMSSYKYDLNGEKTTSIQTQRGCIYSCDFCCGRDIEMYKKVRTHSPKRVIKELDQLHDKYGFSSFMWYDDELNQKADRLEELCERLSTRPYKHRGFVRSDQIGRHPKSVKWMKKAGFVKLCTGVESGSDRILKLIHKGVTSEQNYEAARRIKEAKIHYEAFTMIGHPSETMEDVKQTIKWINRSKPDDFDINVLVPYPGSRIYDQAVRSNKFEGYDWEHKGLYFNKPNYSSEGSFYKGINAQSKVSSRTNSMSEKHIHKMRDKIEAMK